MLKFFEIGKAFWGRQDYVALGILGIRMVWSSVFDVGSDDASWRGVLARTSCYCPVGL